MRMPKRWRMARAVAEKHKLLGHKFLLLWLYGSKIPNPLVCSVQQNIILKVSHLCFYTIWKTRESDPGKQQPRATWGYLNLRWSKFKNQKIKLLSCTGHMSGTQQPYAAGGCCTSLCRHQTFLPSRTVLPGSAAVERSGLMSKILTPHHMGSNPGFTMF